MTSSFDISASGLSAQRQRLDAIANNLANAETTRTAGGGPYKRLQAVLQAEPDGAGVKATIMEDARPGTLTYEPGHPDANADGYVMKPNVNPIEEMVELISATRLYEANVTTLSANKAMIKSALDIDR
jgi:flagellar basal-body rod protein FlgC